MDGKAGQCGRADQRRGVDLNLRASQKRPTEVEWRREEKEDNDYETGGDLSWNRLSCR